MRRSRPRLAVALPYWGAGLGTQFFDLLPISIDALCFLWGQTSETYDADRIWTDLVAHHQHKLPNVI